MPEDQPETRSILLKAQDTTQHAKPAMARRSNVTRNSKYSSLSTWCIPTVEARLTDTSLLRTVCFVPGESPHTDTFYAHPPLLRPLPVSLFIGFDFISIFDDGVESFQFREGGIV